MDIRNWCHVAKVLPLVLVVWGSTAQVGGAETLPFSYQENIDNFGKTPNACPPSNPKGICAAVAAINSFIFLENQYPAIYDNLITPNIQGAKPNQTDPTDRDNFGVNGWQVAGKPARQGYYSRPGSVGGDYVQTKMDWINDYAPGTTIFNSYFLGSAQNDRLPTIEDLANEIQHGEDVEFFVDGGTAGNHALTLTGISCMLNNFTNCSITFLNDGVPVGATSITLGPNGLEVDTGFGNIYAAFSESPVPEPSTMVSTGTALILLGYLGRKRLFRGRYRVRGI